MSMRTFPVEQAREPSISRTDTEFWTSIVRLRIDVKHVAVATSVSISSDPAHRIHSRPIFFAV